MMRYAASASTPASSPLVQNVALSTVQNASSVAVRYADRFLDLSGMSREEALNAVEIMMRAAGK